MLITNAFSLNMFSNTNASFFTCEIGVGYARQLLVQAGVNSAVGHQDTANIFSKILDLDIPCNRDTVSIEQDCSFIVGQYSGPKLEEGATELPNDAKIKWIYVNVNFDRDDEPDEE